MRGNRSQSGKAKIVQALSRQKTDASSSQSLSQSASRNPAREGARPQVSTLVLFGELRERELSKLGETLLHLAHRGQLNVVLDMRGVSHVHFRGVKPLGLLARSFRLGGGDIKLAGASKYLAEVLKAGGSHSLFEVYPTPEEASEAFTRDTLAPSLPGQPPLVKERVAATIIVIGK